MRPVALALAALACLCPRAAVAQTPPAAGGCAALAKIAWPDVRITEAVTVAPILNADNPDLDAFFARRGKLLIWHGWSDAALNAVETIRYHDRVLARNAQAAASMRLFLMPGVQHCAGGPGPDTVDWLAAISAWVERDDTPARIIATKVVNGAAARTRPLCPYPQRAVYTGAGSIDEAAPFVCRAP